MAMIVCLDGRLVPPNEAVVSVFDRGFLYGDSVYEVLRTYGGVPFETDAHLSRLASSAARIAMELPVSHAQIAEEALSAHRASQNSESYLRIVITRGAGKIGLDPALAEGPRRIVIAQDLVEVAPDPKVYERGVDIALVGVRRNLRSALDPQAKTGNYLNSILALHEAKRAGAFEAVMLDHRGLVSEGSSSNIFAVFGDVLATPPLEVGILAGVTRKVVLGLAAGIGLRALEIPFDEPALRQADEVFITSSIREVVPVARIDGKPVGTGNPGPRTQRLMQAFQAYARRPTA